MQVDFAQLDAAVRAAVPLALEAAEAEKRAGRVLPDSGGRSGRMLSVARQASMEFMKPLVHRELRRLALAGVKRVVRLADAFDGSRAELARLCIGAASGAGAASQKRALKVIGEGYHGNVFELSATRVAKLTSMSLIERSGELDELDAEVRMARLAAKIGVGPQVHDAYPCFADVEGAAAGVIVMRRVRGVSLADWVRSKPSAARRKALAARLHAMIAKMHRASLFHHDLHDDNVMVEKGDVPVIIDFGMASSEPQPDFTARFRAKGDDGRHEDFRILDRLQDGDSPPPWRRSKEAARRIVELVLDDLSARGVIRAAG